MGSPYPNLRWSLYYEMVASNAKWQLVTTWNEWGEGTAIEPATEFGAGYIDALCQKISGSVSCAAGAAGASDSWR